MVVPGILQKQRHCLMINGDNGEVGGGLSTFIISSCDSTLTMEIFLSSLTTIPIATMMDEVMQGSSISMKENLTLI